jgi:hypothetical protein
MSLNAQALAIPQQSAFSLAPLCRDAALAAHLGIMAASALCIGFGHVSVELARWGMSVLMDSARSFAN